MAIGINDILRLALYLEIPNGVTGNLVHHYLATAGSGGDAETILGALSTNIEIGLNNMAAYMADGYGTFGAVLWKWDTILKQWDGVGSESTSDWNPVTGGDAMPQTTALQLDFFTNVPRRQGRKYIPGMTEAAQADGTIVAGLVTAATLCALDFVDSVISDGITLVPGVFNTDVESDYYETFEDFNGSIGIETFVSTQRRRKPGVGI